MHKAQAFMTNECLLYYCVKIFWALFYFLVYFLYAGIHLLEGGTFHVFCSYIRDKILRPFLQCSFIRGPRPSIFFSFFTR